MMICSVSSLEYFRFFNEKSICMSPTPWLTILEELFEMIVTGCGYGVLEFIDICCDDFSRILLSGFLYYCIFHLIEETYFLLLFLTLLGCCRRFACFNQGLSRSIFFSGVLQILLRQVYFSLEVFTNLSASILVTCSSHSLLLHSTHTLIGWIP